MNLLSLQCLLSCPALLRFTQKCDSADVIKWGGAGLSTVARERCGSVVNKDKGGHPDVRGLGVEFWHDDQAAELQPSNAHCLHVSQALHARLL